MIEERIEELKGYLADATKEYAEIKKDVDFSESTVANTERDIESTEERMDELQKMIDLFKKQGKTDWKRIQKRADKLNKTYKALNARLTTYLHKLKIDKKKKEVTRKEVNSCGVRINELEKLKKEL